MHSGFPLSLSVECHSVTLRSVLLTSKKSSGAELMALEFGNLGFAESIANLSMLVPFRVLSPS